MSVTLPHLLPWMWVGCGAPAPPAPILTSSGMGDPAGWGMGTGDGGTQGRGDAAIPQRSKLSGRHRAVRDVGAAPHQRDQSPGEASGTTARSARRRGRAVIGLRCAGQLSKQRGAPRRTSKAALSSGVCRPCALLQRDGMGAARPRGPNRTEDRRGPAGSGGVGARRHRRGAPRSCCAEGRARGAPSSWCRPDAGGPSCGR